MMSMGFAVPTGFVVTTDACREMMADDEDWSAQLQTQFAAALKGIEARTGKALGSLDAPLFVSVRAGGEFLMPGVSETVVNLGFNRDTVLAMTKCDPWFAWNSYRRFVEGYACVVLNIHTTRLRRAQALVLGHEDFGAANAAQQEKLVEVLLDIVGQCGHEIPADPASQIIAAVKAVVLSNDNHRAKYFRRTHGIDEDAPTAVCVQAMVFGNRDERSGVGVLSTRDPDSGKNGIVGEWLDRAQGHELSRDEGETLRLDSSDFVEGPALTKSIWMALEDAKKKLEAHYVEMLDIEFTVESGCLFFLEVRTTTRSPRAAVRVAVEMANSGMLSKLDAVMRVNPGALENILRPVIRRNAELLPIATGLAASAGAATGKVVFSTDECRLLELADEPAILVRSNTEPEDIQGMNIAVGLLTSRGGQTSHAAVVSRSLGKPAIVGTAEIQIDVARGVFYAGDTVVRRGDYITVDGTSGAVYAGAVETDEAPDASDVLTTLLGWADEFATMKVRANADDGTGAARAKSLGAVGIGLCRTEHMFFQPEGLLAIRRAILAEGPRERQRAIAEVEPFQRAQYTEILREMDGHPVALRLLDPPLVSFLPTRDEELSEVAQELGVSVSRLQDKITEMKEVNPLCGNRGVRIGISNPEIYLVQMRAIIEAACDLVKQGMSPVPEVLLPLVSSVSELTFLKGLLVDAAESVIGSRGVSVIYTIGCMIEVPRACVVADQLAKHADFFSFGTNDLTQSTYGMSRDDMGQYFAEYQRAGVMKTSPLSRLDEEGVGALVEMGVARGIGEKTNLVLGACGEHCGHAHGIQFFHNAGLHYVSCAVNRVPVARLAAGQAAIQGMQVR
jgi:pyruvate,orthophosphate dikinase